MIMKKFIKYYYETFILEFMRYCLAGGIAFLCDYTMLFVLIEFAGIHYLISSIAGFIAGLLANYILSKRWVFKGSRAKGFGSFFTFSVIGVIGLGVTEVCMWLGVDVLELKYMVVKLFVTGVVLLWNYSARKVFVFSTPVSSKLINQRY